MHSPSAHKALLAGSRGSSGPKPRSRFEMRRPKYQLVLQVKLLALFTSPVPLWFTRRAM